MPRRPWITDWNPNDAARWEGGGRSIAWRNLAFSVLAEFLGFSVWQLWSVVATQLDRAGFHLSVGELFWLVSVPGLVGATLRLPYGMAVPRFGGRNWTVVSAALLLVPAILLAVLVQRPETPFWALLLAAATAGFGGGNFASSMSNISFFFADDRKGMALGVNAAGGNIGVAVVQLVVPLVIGAGVVGAGHPALGNAGLMWVPLIALSCVCAFLFMDNLTVARTSVREQLSALRSRHAWLLTWLYVGTFGSFIGYSAAMPLLLKTAFPRTNAATFVFVGPLLGSLARPLGGWLADRFGGAAVTLCAFAIMAAAAIGLVATLSDPAIPGVLTLFLALFVVLFVSSGAGNGSTFRMIPAVFNAESARAAAGRSVGDRRRIDRSGRIRTAAVLAFSSAIAAYGSFLVPQGYSLSLAGTGGYAAALVAFVCVYLTCMAVTWWCYLRRTAASASAYRSAA